MSSGECQCSPIEEDGYTYNQWIGTNFSDCVYTPLDNVAFWIGMSSLIWWLFCQSPQFIKNWQRGSAEALSKWFLFEWLLGDSTNLVGSILTQQLPTQIYTAILFCSMDAIMLSQYIFFYVRNGRRDKLVAKQLKENLLEKETASGSTRGKSKKMKAEEPSESETHDRTGGSRPLYAFAVPLLIMLPAIAPTLFNAEENLHHFTASSGRVLLDDGSTQDCLPGALEGWVNTVGVALGWVSSVFYLSSRIPQVVKNYKRKSVEGLSWIMFVAAVLGNGTYALGVMLRYRNVDGFVHSLPWMLGSVGTLFFDALIFFQLQWYKADPAVRKLTGDPNHDDMLPRTVHDIIE